MLLLNAYKYGDSETSFYIARLNIHGNSANMKLNSNIGLACIAFTLITSGCASLIYKQSQPIYLFSNEPEASLYVNGEEFAEGSAHVMQKHRFKGNTLQANFEDAINQKSLDSKFRPISILGLPLIVPFAYDLYSGAAKAHTAQTAYFEFEDGKSEYPYKITTTDGSYNLDAFSLAENPKKSFGKIKSNKFFEDIYLDQVGYASNGVYTPNHPGFKIAFKTLDDSSNTKLIPANMVNSYWSSAYESGLSEVLDKNWIAGIQYVKVSLDKIEWLSANINKGFDKTELYQFWPVLSEKDGQKIIFQPIETRSNSELINSLDNDVFDVADNYFVFCLWKDNKIVQLSEAEFIANYSYLSANPHIQELMSASKDKLSLQSNLNENKSFLTNILAWEWSQHANENFYPNDIQAPKGKKSKPLNPRTGDPALLAKDQKAVEDNQQSLNTYSNTLSGTKPTKTQSSEADKYYGTEAPWYLQGQLKPEYRKSASDLGLKEEEIYDPTPAKIDSTKWLKEPQFELVAPDLKPFKAGIHPGYDNENDPRKKPTEVDDTPWYLKDPKQKKKASAGPTGKN